MAQPIGFEELQPLLADGAQVVEVLPEEDFRELHLPNAINIPLKELDADTTAQLSRSDPVVVYCWDAL